MLSVTGETFAQEVEQISRGMPGVVDFWGEGCSPCVALSRVLERLEPEYATRIKLVKLDIGAPENLEVTQRLGIRGIPTLLAFAGGEPVRRSVGNVPEAELRKFFDAALAGRGDVQATYREGIKALQDGDRSRGIAVLREALQRDPMHIESRLALLLELGRIPGPVDDQKLRELNDELWELFPQLAILAQYAYPEEVRAIQLRIDGLNDRSVMPTARALRERLEKAPEDDWARLTLVRRLIAEGDFKEAAERLLTGFECGDAASGSIYFRTFRAAHILAGTLNDVTEQQMDQAMERGQASRQKNA
jgi:thioredoxin 1